MDFGDTLPEGHPLIEQRRVNTQKLYEFLKTLGVGPEEGFHLLVVCAIETARLNFSGGSLSISQSAELVVDMASDILEKANRDGH